MLRVEDQRLVMVKERTADQSLITSRWYFKRLSKWRRFIFFWRRFTAVLTKLQQTFPILHEQAVTLRLSLSFSYHGVR